MQQWLLREESKHIGRHNSCYDLNVTRAIFDEIRSKRAERLLQECVRRSYLNCVDGSDNNSRGCCDTGSYQQQLQEYIDMLPRQVDPALAAPPR
jgi:hypothetical protein